MIQLSSLMWAMAVFFALVGYMRGWSKEVIATAGIVLATFALFQFDSLIRGVLASVSRDQMFLVQTGVFLTTVVIAYRTRMVASRAGRAEGSANQRAWRWWAL
jgi:uncharacterized membrane protein required for colicin V production